MRRDCGSLHRGSSWGTGGGGIEQSSEKMDRFLTRKCSSGLDWTWRDHQGGKCLASFMSGGHEREEDTL
jgi:hypothetical protein